MKLDKRVTLAVLGAAAAGVGIGVVYYLSKQRAEVGVSVQLEQSHVSWLQEVADKYKQGDSRRALQALIEHCHATSKDSVIEKQIFEEVRCNSCGKKEKVDYNAVMTGAQLAFVRRMTQKHGIIGEEKALRIMFEYAIHEVDAVAIFGL